MHIRNCEEHLSYSYQMIDLLVKELNIDKYESISIFSIISPSTINLVPLFNLLIYLNKTVVFPVNNDRILGFYRVTKEQDLTLLTQGKINALTFVDHDLIELHILPFSNDLSKDETLIRKINKLKGIKVLLHFEDDCQYCVELVNTVHYVITEKQIKHITKKP